MKISLPETLKRLEARPDLTAELAAIHPGKSRTEAAQAMLNVVTATQSENASRRNLLAARKAKIVALEAAKVANQRLRASLAASKALVAAKQARRTTAKPSGKPTIRQQYNALATPEARQKFRAANWSALLSSPK